MDELKIGDVVQLKSGGQTMTIEHIGQYPMKTGLSAKCVWFDGKKACSELFGLATLEIATQHTNVAMQRG
jgi:uncharacterized protein YodC (DUF2158 family)